MTRRTRLFTPLLALTHATSGAWAGKKMFNIHDDLLAHPQYQVRFPDDYVLESQADELLRAQHASAYAGANVEQKQAQVYMSGSNKANRDGEDGEAPEFSYEAMNLDGQRFLCEIPRVDLDNRNQTKANEPNEDEEKRELARATDRGLELLRELEGKCMYYVSGWWSYSLCYKRQIKQFHALPAGGGIPSYPPMEDPTTHSFVLGRFPRKDDRSDIDEEPMQKRTATDVAELQTKGGSRYLVQKLEGGTVCDLTGKSRKIEIQFHCHPQSTDRIGWIKELTTCSYLMVVYTPRLCNDVAFLPPQQDEVYPVDCHEILAHKEVADWEAMREYQLSQKLVESGIPLSDIPIVGDIEVGAQKLVGAEGKRIEKGRVASVGEEKVDIVAKRENGKVQVLSKNELKKYDLDPDKIETLKRHLEKEAKGRDWTLEMVEVNGERGLRGVIESDEEEEDGSAQVPDESEQIETPAAKDDEKSQKGQKQPEPEPAAEVGNSNEPEDSPGEAEQGSEEVFFRDEL
ncbi:PRKCSH domain-containing protein [Aspergillus chevalieri]|uniref:Endoplasmic reticulum lectin n=1 Tax=Aspergillus chevalieri TaxID=182096 RepID=A0A7R7VTZ6_ASPCH|nr:protein OS-9 [Aspergillus chevalieri]BCR90778.1 protein OS-9 [Aspergillus chevalieri]